MAKFNNRQNKLISKKNIEDQKFFHSRSVALVATVLFYNEYMDEYFILLGKRGKGTPDVKFRGFWNLPCGYLDWDETAEEGIKREVFEETGVDIEEISKRTDYTVLNDENLKQSKPWVVQTASIKGRQNVSLYYAFEFSGNYFPMLTTKYSEPDEVEDVRWVALSDIDEMENEFAFNHFKRIKQFISQRKR